jgi:hypothetical protein
VIGVVKSPPSLEPSGIARPAVYVPWAQYPMANVTLMLRTSVAARAVAAQVRDTTAAGLPGGASISRLRTGRDIVAEADARSTFIARQLSALAVIAVLLAFTGLYGVSAHDAALRTREMAVRSALGSTPASLLAIMRRSLRPSCSDSHSGSRSPSACGSNGAHRGTSRRYHLVSRGHHDRAVRHGDAATGASQWDYEVARIDAARLTAPT